MRHECCCFSFVFLTNCRFNQQCLAQGGQLNPNAAQTGLKRAFSNGNGSSNKNQKGSDKDSPPLPPELEGFDKEIVERVFADIIVQGHPVTFNDISGLDFAKSCVTELICW
jgi:hypothetical protein